MTAVLDATPGTEADDVGSSRPLASWGARAGAFSLDVFLGIGVIAVLGLLAYSAVTVSEPNWLWLVYVSAAAVVFAAMAVNRLLLPTITGCANPPPTSCFHTIVGGLAAQFSRIGGPTMTPS